MAVTAKLIDLTFVKRRNTNLLIVGSSRLRGFQWAVFTDSEKQGISARRSPGKVGQSKICAPARLQIPAEIQRVLADFEYFRPARNLGIWIIVQMLGIGLEGVAVAGGRFRYARLRRASPQKEPGGVSHSMNYF